MVVSTALNCRLPEERTRWIGVSIVHAMSLFGAVLATSMLARADAPVAFNLPKVADVAPHDPSHVFIVAKNHNRNQVHYGVHVDDACLVVGPQPVHGYWRMFERNGEVEPLLERELSAYGVDPSQRIERSGNTTTIRTRLNAAPDHALTITVKRVAGRCVAQAFTSIAGSDALLRWVYVRFRWPMGVDYILLHGARTADGAVVEERI
jgi:hypothetical protein